MTGMQAEGLKKLATEAGAELRRILDWWSEKMPDRTAGGFLGRIDGHGITQASADKSVILNTRILWAFSAGANATHDPRYRQMADRAATYLLEHFIDPEHGGVYWMLDCRGGVVEPKKQVYAQAFGIYALSEYYALSRDVAALEAAFALFQCIEKYSFDRRRNGYFEAFSREWRVLSDLRLSEKDANEAKTMNTHLHVLEAYTRLYQVGGTAAVKNALHRITALMLDRFVDPSTRHLHLFFDEDWNLKSDIISFGHDIEAAWLFCRAAEATGDAQLIVRARNLAVDIAQLTLNEGMDADGGLFNEAGPAGITDRNKDWWPQAEAMVGFLNAWHISAEPRFEAAALRSWAFIQENLLDRQNGEWFWALGSDGQPDRKNDKAGPWKCPYHNSRACLIAAQG